MNDRISVSGLRRLLENRGTFAFLDVRERGEYDSRHISGACSIPRQEIEFRLDELVPARNTAMVLYDDNGDRARLASAAVRSMGYETVRILDGGLEAWVSAGFPTESGINVPSKAFGEWVHGQCSVPEITAEEFAARKARDDRFLILDARTPEEFGRFCIPEGENVPGGDLILWASDLARDPTVTVVVNCAGRTRSILGAQSLRRLGLGNVYALKNGTMGWTLAGLELESEPHRTPREASRESRRQAKFLAHRLAQEEVISLIGWQELRELMDRRQKGDQTVYLIDVRAREEFLSGHIPGFQWIPGGQAIQRADDFIAVPAGTVIFACDGGPRAVMVAYWYKKMGYRDVRALRGGIEAWIESGGEVEKGAPVRHNFLLQRAEETVRYVSCSGLAAELRKSPNFLILDVGTSREFAAGHLPESKWVSRGWLELVIPAKFGDRDQEVVTTCRTGEQSSLAANTLEEMGYRNVRVLRGGVREWERSGGVTEKEMAGALIEPKDVAVPASQSGQKELMVQYLDWELALGRSYQGSFLSFH